MASRIIVHIGQQKSGTTYLQHILRGSADTLWEAGVLYPLSVPARLPLPRRRRRIEINHERATYGLLGTEYPWVSKQRAEEERPAWERLVRQVRSHPGTVLLSAEALSVIRTSAIYRIVEALGASDVDVVVTARHLGKILPSWWQQHVRNGRSGGFERRLQTLEQQRLRPPEDREDKPDLHFWREYALGGLVLRWAKVVGLDHVRVVTNAPKASAELLWARFAEAVDAPEPARNPPDDLLTKRTHEALTAPEVAVLASVNAALTKAGWDERAANELRTRIITHGFLPRPDRGPRVVVPAERRDRVAEWAEEDLAELADTGVTVIGDFADLRYDPAADGVPEPDRKDVAAATAAAVLAVAAGR